MIVSISAFQSPESLGADISEYRLEWGEDKESLELVYHGTETGFEIRDLLPAAQYCCQLQVKQPFSDDIQNVYICSLKYIYIYI